MRTQTQAPRVAATRSTPSTQTVGPASVSGRLCQALLAALHHPAPRQGVPGGPDVGPHPRADGRLPVQTAPGSFSASALHHCGFPVGPHAQGGRWSQAGALSGRGRCVPRGQLLFLRTGVPGPDMGTHSTSFNLQRPPGDGSCPQPSGKPVSSANRSQFTVPSSGQEWALGVVHGFPFLN